MIFNAKSYPHFHRDDMEMMLNKIVPEGLPYRHSCEGPDDMVSVTVLFAIKRFEPFNCGVVDHNHRL